MKIKNFLEDILWFWISESIGKSNIFLDICQNVIKVSYSECI